MPPLTTQQTAARLGISRSRVLHLIHAGRLLAVKVGRDWQISETEVARFAAIPRKPGKRAREEIGQIGP